MWHQKTYGYFFYAIGLHVPKNHLNAKLIQVFLIWFQHLQKNGFLHLGQSFNQPNWICKVCQLMLSFIIINIKGTIMFLHMQKWPLHLWNYWEAKTTNLTLCLWRLNKKTYQSSNVPALTGQKIVANLWMDAFSFQHCRSFSDKHVNSWRYYILVEYFKNCIISQVWSINSNLCMLRISLDAIMPNHTSKRRPPHAHKVLQEIDKFIQ